jgi:hypothetical protein
MKRKVTYALAEAQIEGRTWKFGFTDWTGNRIYIEDESGARIAETKPRHWWSYVVDLELSGRRYTLTTNMWWTRHIAEDEGGNPIVTLRPRWWHGETEVLTTHSATDQTTLLLAMLLMYRRKVIEAQSAAAAGGGSVAVSAGS